MPALPPARPLQACQPRKRARKNGKCRSLHAHSIDYYFLPLVLLIQLTDIAYMR
jgi:hypothetical protein